MANNKGRNWTVAVECKLSHSDLLLARRAGMAKEFGINEATLGRYLVHEGTHWQELLDKERKRRCVSVLRTNKRACCYRLMQRCGLGRQAMHKSIRRWFGATLTDIRNNQSILYIEAAS